jgi:hypothetical protein
VKHEARLSKRTDDGSTVRVHLEAAAARGSASAAAELEGPDCPEEVLYLVEWAHALFGRSGIGMSNVAPLTYGTIAHWARLTDTKLHPFEVSALILLDDVMREPEERREEAEAPKPTRDAPAWPARKTTPAPT